MSENKENTPDEKPKTTMNERFKHMRSEILNLNQTKLAEICGLDYRNIGDIETGRTKRLSPEMCCILVEKYGINMNWLLCGEGEPTEKDKEDEFIYKFRTDLTVPVPFYHAKASAGLGEMLKDYVEKDVLYFDKRWLTNIIGVSPNNVSLVTAKGNSMCSGRDLRDDINDGDLLLVNNAIREVINGKIFVVTLNGDLLVKKMYKDFNGEITLVSNNPDYKPIKITEFDEGEILGKVVWNGSRETV